MYFSSLLLEIMGDNLNMMLTEIAQLAFNGKKINYKNHDKLILIVLKEIANGNIKSSHMKDDYAKKAIKLYYLWKNGGHHISKKKEIILNDERRIKEFRDISGI